MKESILLFLIFSSFVAKTQSIDSLIQLDHISWIATLKNQYKFEDENSLYISYKSKDIPGFTNSTSLLKIDVSNENDKTNASTFFMDKLIEAEINNQVNDSLESRLIDLIYIGRTENLIDSNTIEVIFNSPAFVPIESYEINQLWAYDEINECFYVTILEISPLSPQEEEMEWFQLMIVNQNQSPKNKNVKWIKQTENIINLNDSFHVLKGQKASSFISSLCHNQDEDIEFASYEQIWSLEPKGFKLKCELIGIKLYKRELHESENIFFELTEFKNK